MCPVGVLVTRSLFEKPVPILQCGGKTNRVSVVKEG